MLRSDYSIDWRHNLIVALTTLRATGHVLHKIDVQRFPELRAVVEGKYKRWKQGSGDDELFKYFINDSRNQLLKTYQFNTSDDLAFEQEEIDSGDIDVVTEGHFKGSDVVGLLQHSATWWMKELDEIATHIDAQPTTNNLVAHQ